MKKTVSWSADIMKRKSVSADATNNQTDKASRSGGNGASKSTKITKSTSAFVPTQQSQAPQVNLRIQNMIAMQKAQNATMQKLMSSGSAMMASPSGLRDLVQSPHKGSPARTGMSMASSPARTGLAAATAAAASRGSNFLGLGLSGGNNSMSSSPKPAPGSAYGNNASLGGSSRTEPMKPPAPDNTNAFSHQVAGIHFQGPQKSSGNVLQYPPSNLSGMQQQLHASAYHRDLRQVHVPDLSPAHLHPKLPANMMGSQGDADSPVSYNSVLGVDHHRQHNNQSSISNNPFPQLKGMDHELQIHQSAARPHVVEMPKNIIGSQQQQASSSLPPSMIGEMNISLNPRGQVVTNVLGPNGSAPVQSIGQHYPNMMDNNTMAMMPTNPHEMPPPAQPMQTPMQTLLHGDTAVSPLASHTHHKFNYGSDAQGGDNTYVDGSLSTTMMDQHNHHYLDVPNDATFYQMQSRIRRKRRNIMLTILCYPFQSLFSNEHLCRSFCFGAIDGMLTGASILSALAGLGLLSELEVSDGVYINMKWIPTALTMAVAFSDGFCMAIGHVWASGLEAGTAYKERKEELRNFEIYKSDAKARLVDALLMQGMLKIDAMSLADTLEGYPDLFVNALLGKGLCMAEADDGQGGSGAGGMGMMRGYDGNAPHWQLTQQSEPAQTGLENEGLYGLAESHDPDLQVLSETVAESKSEGFLMMLSFSSFSAVPSLIYTLLPAAANILVADDSTSILLSLCLTTIIMFFLGMWKSHFYGSNWFTFGVKNMAVMAICAATAYYFGFVCSNFIGAVSKSSCLLHVKSSSTHYGH